MSDVLVKKLFLTVRRLEVPSSDTWRLTAIVDGETVSKGLRVPVAPLDVVASGIAEEEKPWSGSAFPQSIAEQIAQLHIVRFRGQLVSRSLGTAPCPFSFHRLV